MWNLALFVAVRWSPYA